MPSKRHDIQNEDVIKYLEEGHNISEAARHFGCCHRLIRNARDGIRPNPPKIEHSEEELCTACKTRPKDPKLRYLCKKCYRDNPDGSSDHTEPGDRWKGGSKKGSS